jgi:nucleoside-diphosphate-sugar epimerase
MVEKFYEGKISAGEVFNIGGITTMTVEEMLHKLLALSPDKGRISIRQDEQRIRPADVTLQIPCIDKFQSHTGWKPEISFETTLRDTLNYWREKLSKGIS